MDKSTTSYFVASISDDVLSVFFEPTESNIFLFSGDIVREYDIIHVQNDELYFLGLVNFRFCYNNVDDIYIAEIKDPSWKECSISVIYHDN